MRKKIKQPDVRETMQKLQLLNLRECHTVGEIVGGMANCSFGARMLGNVALTLTTWVQEEPRPIIVYDGPLNTRLGRELHAFVKRKWFRGMYSSPEYARSHPRGRVLVVGEYMERHAQVLASYAEQIIFENKRGQVIPGRVRDGFFPGVVFSDPTFVNTVHRATHEERLHESTPRTVSDILEVKEP
ncbi:hypothetical protein HY629_00300, partial [Candidatus Uhrbacteria bacterium]|nr:hypothetical protein [Candidatus Uhrbacteria bacterium]